MRSFQEQIPPFLNGFASHQILSEHLVKQSSYFLRECKAREARVRDEEGEARKEGGAVRGVTELATVWCPCD